MAANNTIGPYQSIEVPFNAYNNNINITVLGRAKVYVKENVDGVYYFFSNLNTETVTYTSSSFPTDDVTLRIDTQENGGFYQVGGVTSKNEPGNLIGLSDLIIVAADGELGTNKSGKLFAIGAGLGYSAAADEGVGGNGGPLIIYGADGGDTDSPDSDSAGRAGHIELQGALGGTATAGTGDGGNGSSIIMTPGQGGSSAGGDAGKDGVVLVKSAPILKSVTFSEIADSGVITAEEHRGQGITQDTSGGNTSLTTADAADIALEFPLMTNGVAIEQYFSNETTNTITVNGGTGVTVIGTATVGEAGGRFLLIKTSNTTFDMRRVG